MDPFSLTVGSLNLLDACQRFTKFVVNLYKGTKTIDKDLQALFEQVEDLERVLVIIRNIDETEQHRISKDNTAKHHNLSNILASIASLLPKCKTVVDKLYSTLANIEAAQLPRFLESLDTFYKELRRKAKEVDFVSLQRNLRDYHETISMLLVAANYCLTREGAASQELSAADTRESFLNLNAKLDQLQSRLESVPSGVFHNVFSVVKAIVESDSNNKHFDIPQAVSSIFTGRQSMLDTLESWMFDTNSPRSISTYRFRNVQKRFVVYGLGGSGKTQFCCKFAQQHRERFWGVFWIDGTSKEKAEHTLAILARNGGLEENARAAKRWLATLDKPWLLIIDSADDPNLDLEALFPEGNRGYILITTTNPEHKTQGTVGDGFFDFSPGDPDYAETLLLRASSTPQPWSKTAQDLAAAIVSSLGYLPLAIIIAGKTILKGKCTLHDYIKFYETDLQRTRQQMHRRKSQTNLITTVDAKLTVYATCETTYKALLSGQTQASQDAVELLNIFSFLNKDNISLQLLRHAAINPLLENADNASVSDSNRGKSWQAWLQQIMLKLYAFSNPDLPKLVLPDVLLAIDSDPDAFDIYRVREALSELASRSLIMYYADKDTYSVHPIIHRWVRDRPEMTTAGQAICCEAAATLLSQAILLPPHGTNVEDADFRRKLFPHVVSVLAYQKTIENQFQRNRSQDARQLRFFSVSPKMNRQMALRLAKYSFVFVQCGKYETALDQQLKVHDFLHRLLGPWNEKTIRIKMALSGTYWHLGRGSEAATLQEDALACSVRALGKSHVDTLRLMDHLACSFWMLGRYKDALALHKNAISGLEQKLGPEDVDVLRAKDHLGRVESKYYRFESARCLHSAAAEGLSRLLGPEHDDTLIALDNLANVLMELNEESGWIHAQDTIEKVLAVRKEKLGTEHYYTLWSMLSLARIKARRGFIGEAESDIRAGLLIAYQTLGPTHLGVFTARMYLGNILNLGGKNVEAINELEDVRSGQASMASATHGLHPDLFFTLYLLSACYRDIGRYDDAINACAEAMKGLRDFGGHEHPLMKKLDDRMIEIVKERESVLRRARDPA